MVLPPPSCQKCARIGMVLPRDVMYVTFHTERTVRGGTKSLRCEQPAHPLPQEPARARWDADRRCGRAAQSVNQVNHRKERSHHARFGDDRYAIVPVSVKTSGRLSKPTMTLLSYCFAFIDRLSTWPQIAVQRDVVHQLRVPRLCTCAPCAPRSATFTLDL